MKGASRTWILAALAMLGFAAPLRAAETTDVTDADRAYRNYTREAATVRAGEVRLEVRGMTLEDDGDTSLNLLGFPVRDRLAGATEVVTGETGGIFDVMGSYGLGKAAEVGFILPTFIQTQRLRSVEPRRAENGEIERDDQGNPIYDRRTSRNQDLGDVQLYGKFKQPVAEHCAVAGGMELSLPTGPERKSFGTGDMGFNPFVSTRYQQGRFGTGAHVGYQMFTGNGPDVLNYSVEAFVRGSASYAIRAELSGRFFQMAGKRFHDVVVMPGIDFNLTPNFTVRPTGLANVTDEAMDWGVGLGLAYTF